MGWKSLEALGTSYTNVGLRPYTLASHNLVRCPSPYDDGEAISSRTTTTSAWHLFVVEYRSMSLALVEAGSSVDSGVSSKPPTIPPCRIFYVVRTVALRSNPWQHWARSGSCSCVSRLCCSAWTVIAIACPSKRKKTLHNKHETIWFSIQYIQYNHGKTSTKYDLRYNV